MTVRSCILPISAALLVLVSSAAHISGMRSSAETAVPKITVLYDAFGKDSLMQKDWGYAALVEYGDQRILFDTGNNPDVLARNAKAKGADLSRLDFVVVSHRHGDHMGGLSYVLSVNPKVTIYAPKEGFGVFGADLPSSFYRKDPSLPPEQRYYDGAPPETMRFGSAWPGANFQLCGQKCGNSAEHSSHHTRLRQTGYSRTARTLSRHQHLPRTDRRGGLFASRH